MRGLRGTTALIVLAAGVVLGAERAEAALPVEIHGCIETIDHSFELKRDVGPCSTAGWTVSKPGITIDLGGHALYGNGTDDSASDFGVVSGQKDTRIRNGVISGFDQGIRFSGAGSRLRAVVASGNATVGIVVSGGARITRSRASRNGAIGIWATGDVTIAKTKVLGNEQVGIRVDSGDAVISRTIASGNGAGIHVGGDAAISKTTATGNRLTGIRVYDPSFGGGGAGVVASISESSASGNGSGSSLDEGGIDLRGNVEARITESSASENDDFGVRISGGKVSASKANGNVGHGIVVDDALQATQLVDNETSGNSLNGVNLGGDGHVLKRNVASGNGFRGIAYNGNAYTFYKNIASDNGEEGIRAFTALGGVFDANVADANGFKSGATGTGHGITAPSDATGSGNKARGNRTPGCVPAPICS